MAAPVLELAGVRRELAVVGLWVRGWQGRLGPVERTLSRREMIGLDRAAAEVGESDNAFALPAGIVGPTPHYPDLLLAAGDDRMPVVMLVWPHRPTDISGLLTGFLALPNVAFVNVCVDRDEVAAEVQTLVDQWGLAERVRVREISLGAAPPMG